MVNLIRTICATAAVFFIQVAVFAQEAGFFVHTIRQGETVYSIARTYQVSPDEILKLNPSAAAGIRTGATLQIPQKAGGTRAERFHTIAAGETLYRLTKTYQVSAEDICKANPGLTAENFKVGMVVRIPAASVQVPPTTPSVTPEPQGIAKSDCKEMHKVGRKETVYGIARQYGITEDELKAANPEMKAPDFKLKKGTFVCIPYPTVRKPQEITPTNEELMPKKAIAAPQKHISMGVILPFKSHAAETAKMVEFYRGVLIAVDSVKRSGISVDVFAYDSGKSPADIIAVTKNHPISKLDFIIGPLYPDQIAPLSKFCKENRIKLVVPFSSLGEELYNNPDFYAVNPPKSFLISEAVQLTTEVFGKDNIIFLEGNEKDNDASAFTDTIEKHLLEKGVQAKSIRLEGDEMAWLTAMNQYRTNVIIPDASSIKLLNQLFPKLKEFCKKHPEYRIKLVGHPEWQTYTSSLLDNFYQFDTYVYSSFYRNPLQRQTSEFEKNYLKTFLKPTISSWPRFGMLGFDIGFYFLKGISLYGKAFDSNVSRLTTTHYQHRFSFERISNWSGFINKEIHFIHYSPSHSIELIRLKR